MSTGSRAGLTTRRRIHPTSSKEQAAAWLLRSERPQAEFDLFIAALDFTDALHREVQTQRRASEAMRRVQERIRRLAENLARAAPGTVDFKVLARQHESEWKIPNLHMEIERAFQRLNPRRPATTRFLRAVAALPGTAAPGHDDEQMDQGTTAAAVLAIAARCVRIRPPSGLEAAVLAIKAEFEEPALHDSEQVEAERRWRARFRLVRGRARAALLDRAYGLRHAVEFPPAPGGAVKRRRNKHSPRSSPPARRQKPR